MKTLGVLLLLVGTVFGQQIADISAANSPLHVSSSASVVSGTNVASKEILLYVVALGLSWTYTHDYYFKTSGIQPGGAEIITVLELRQHAGSTAGPKCCTCNSLTAVPGETARLLRTSSRCDRCSGPV